VPNVEDLKQLIMKEAHDSKYSIHPGGTKMYQDLKQRFWWHGMKREIAFFVARCDICQRVKADTTRIPAYCHKAFRRNKCHIVAKGTYCHDMPSVGISCDRTNGNRAIATTKRLWRTSVLLQQLCAKLPHFLPWQHVAYCHRFVCGDCLTQQIVNRGDYLSVAISICCNKV
jgi:hypothetical protein